MRSAAACRRAPGCTRPCAHPSCRPPRAWIPAGSCVLQRGHRGLHQRLLDLPALALRDRPVLDDPHPVTHRAGVRLVVREEARMAAHELVVGGVLHEALHAHHHGLVHLVAHHDAFERPALSASTHWLAPSFSRSTVCTRARSRRSLRSSALFSSWPVAFFTRAVHSSPCSSATLTSSSCCVSSRSSLAFITTLHAPRSASAPAACAVPDGRPRARSRR